EDLGILFEILRRNLPLGQRAWSRCADEFNEQAEQQGRPTRLAKSLELKYKQLVKTTKPTGDAELPRNVEEALEIEELMNDKAGTRDLNDSDIDSDSDKENAPTRKKSKMKTFQAQADALSYVNSPSSYTLHSKHPKATVTNILNLTVKASNA
ncbi:hypothetical protein EV359DRAFT_67175, partial [Lentinula novae-zelandiae]